MIAATGDDARHTVLCIKPDGGKRIVFGTYDKATAEHVVGQLARMGMVATVVPALASDAPGVTRKSAPWKRRRDAAVAYLDSVNY